MIYCIKDNIKEKLQNLQKIEENAQANPKASANHC